MKQFEVDDKELEDIIDEHVADYKAAAIKSVPEESPDREFAVEKINALTDQDVMMGNIRAGMFNWKNNKDTSALRKKLKV